MEKRRVFISAERIAKRVQELGAEIARDYKDKPLVLVCVLRGSFIFAADLARAIDLPLKVEFLRAQSYGTGTKSSGVVQITLDLESPIEGQNVLIIEDIVETGTTLKYLCKHLQLAKPASLKICSLLQKPGKSLEKIKLDYLGFSIEDPFVLGYGLDVAHFHRNLPYIAQLTQEEEESHSG